MIRKHTVYISSRIKEDDEEIILQRIFHEAIKSRIALDFIRGHRSFHLQRHFASPIDTARKNIHSSDFLIDLRWDEMKESQSTMHACSITHSKPMTFKTAEILAYADAEEQEMNRFSELHPSRYLRVHMHRHEWRICYQLKHDCAKSSGRNFLGSNYSMNEIALLLVEIINKHPKEDLAASIVQHPQLVEATNRLIDSIHHHSAPYDKFPLLVCFDHPIELDLLSQSLFDNVAQEMKKEVVPILLQKSDLKSQQKTLFSIIQSRLIKLSQSSTRKQEDVTVPCNDIFSFETFMKSINVQSRVVLFLSGISDETYEAATWLSEAFSLMFHISDLIQIVIATTSRHAIAEGAFTSCRVTFPFNHHHNDHDKDITSLQLFSPPLWWAHILLGFEKDIWFMSNLWCALDESHDWDVIYGRLLVRLESMTDLNIVRALMFTLAHLNIKLTSRQLSSLMMSCFPHLKINFWEKIKSLLEIVIDFDHDSVALESLSFEKAAKRHYNFDVAWSHQDVAVFQAAYRFLLTDYQAWCNTSICKVMIQRNYIPELCHYLAQESVCRFVDASGQVKEYIEFWSMLKTRGVHPRDFFSPKLLVYACVVDVLILYRESDDILSTLSDLEAQENNDQVISARIFRALGKVLWAKKRYYEGALFLRASVSMIEKASETDDRLLVCAASWIDLAEAHVSQHKHKEAITIASKVGQLFQGKMNRFVLPLYISSVILISDCYRYLHNASQALQELASAYCLLVKYGCQDHAAFKNILYAMGRCYQRMGRYVDAFHLFTSAFTKSLNLFGFKGQIMNKLCRSAFRCITDPSQHYVSFDKNMQLTPVSVWSTVFLFCYVSQQEVGHDHLSRSAPERMVDHACQIKELFLIECLPELDLESLYFLFFHLHIDDTEFPTCTQNHKRSVGKTLRQSILFRSGSEELLRSWSSISWRSLVPDPSYSILASILRAYSACSREEAESRILDMIAVLSTEAASFLRAEHLLALSDCLHQFEDWNLNTSKDILSILLSSFEKLCKDSPVVHQDLGYFLAHHLPLQRDHHLCQRFLGSTLFSKNDSILLRMIAFSFGIGLLELSTEASELETCVKSVLTTVCWLRDHLSLRQTNELLFQTMKRAIALSPSSASVVFIECILSQDKSLSFSDFNIFSVLERIACGEEDIQSPSKSALRSFFERIECIFPYLSRRCGKDVISFVSRLAEIHLSLHMNLKGWELLDCAICCLLTTNLESAVLDENVFFSLLNLIDLNGLPHQRDCLTLIQVRKHQYLMSKYGPNHILSTLSTNQQSNSAKLDGSAQGRSRTSPSAPFYGLQSIRTPRNLEYIIDVLERLHEHDDNTLIEIYCMMNTILILPETEEELYLCKRCIEIMEEVGITDSGFFAKACIKSARLLMDCASEAEIRILLDKGISRLESTSFDTTAYIHYLNIAADVLIGFDEGSAADFYRHHIKYIRENIPGNPLRSAEAIIDIADHVLEKQQSNHSCLSIAEEFLCEALALVTRICGENSHSHFQTITKVVDVYVPYGLNSAKLGQFLETKRALAIRLFGQHHDYVYEVNALIRDLHAQAQPSFQVSFHSDSDGSNDEEDDYFEFFGTHAHL